MARQLGQQFLDLPDAGETDIYGRRWIAPGITAYVRAADRKVLQLNRWEEADALVEAGVLRRHHCGPSTYGHVDYYLA